jgi:hypothetical protein
MSLPVVELGSMSMTEGIEFGPFATASSYAPRPHVF